MTAAARPRLSRAALVGVGATVLALAGGSTIAAAAVSGVFSHGWSHLAGSPAYPYGIAGGARAASCAAPTLPGSLVDIRLADMGAMMGGSGAMMGGSGWRSYPAGMMRLIDSPSTVRHSQVSFRVTNAGLRTHELVVLPLATGEQPGRRSVGSDGKVDERGSLGEASASCAAGEGDGITAGATGWVTLTLPAGRYELVCNLPGHYAAGMWAELDVT